MTTRTSCRVRLDAVARHAGLLTPQVSATALILPLRGEQGSNKGARKRRHLKQKLRQSPAPQVKPSHQAPPSATSCRLEQQLQRQHQHLTSKPAKTSTHSRLCREPQFQDLVKFVKAQASVANTYYGREHARNNQANWKSKQQAQGTGSKGKPQTQQASQPRMTTVYTKSAVVWSSALQPSSSSSNGRQGVRQRVACASSSKQQGKGKAQASRNQSDCGSVRR